MKKIETFIPKEALTTIQEALLKADAGRIGNYAGCMTWYPVMGSWIPLEGAKPYCGRTSGRVTVEEIKIEVLAEDGNVNDVVSDIRRVHPYEEPVINVIQLL